MTTYGLSIGDQLKIQRLRSQGMGWEHVAQVMGMKLHAIRKALDVKYVDKSRCKSQERAAEIRAVSAAKRAAGLSAPEHRKAKPPAEVLAERDWAAIEPRSISALAFGDPPPSRSALAKRT